MTQYHTHHTNHTTHDTDTQHTQHTPHTPHTTTTTTTHTSRTQHPQHNHHTTHHTHHTDHHLWRLISRTLRMQSLIHVGRGFTRIHHHIEGPPQLSPGQGLGEGEHPSTFHNPAIARARPGGWRRSTEVQKSLEPCLGDVVVYGSYLSTEGVHCRSAKTKLLTREGRGGHP